MENSITFTVLVGNCAVGGDPTEPSCTPSLLLYWTEFIIL